jgi:branched-chain amino acid transport system permease protein
VAVLGLKLLTGFNGQFSLGHALFLAVGAYTAGVLVNDGWSYWLALPAATAATFALGYAIGWPALRIRGHHLAILTFVLALAAPQIIRSSVLTPITGGPMGLSLSITAPALGDLGEDLRWYLCILAVALSALAAAALIVRSRFGRALEASRDSVAGAQAAGVDTARVNTTSFGLSAGFTGLAGGLMAGPIGYLGPDSFPAFLGIGLYVMVIATGPRWLFGSFLGGLFVFFLPSWAQDIAVGLDKSQALIFAAYGVLLLLLIMPQAIDWRALRVRRRGRTTTAKTDRG